MFESSYTAAILEGKREGIKEGEKKKAVNIARKLLKTGSFELKTIAEMTELTEEDVRALQAEHEG